MFTKVVRSLLSLMFVKLCITLKSVFDAHENARLAESTKSSSVILKMCKIFGITVVYWAKSPSVFFKVISWCHASNEAYKPPEFKSNVSDQATVKSIQP